MKSARHIISNLHIEYKEFATKFALQQEMLRFKNGYFPLYIREQLLFMVLKNNQLLLAFKHKALCTEINHYKHKEIIDSLQMNANFFPLLSKATSLKAYVPTHILNQNQIKRIPSNMIFKEKASVSFKNNATNPAIYDLFEQIRLSIGRINDTSH